jgi:hypothetical protein
LRKTFALKHDGEDVTNSAVLGLAGGDQFAEEILGGFPLNGFRRRRRRRMINTVPLRNEPFAVARALAVLRLPAFFADIHADELVMLLQEKGLARLLVGERAFASLAHVRARLDIPFVHLHYC